MVERVLSVDAVRDSYRMVDWMTVSPKEEMTVLDMTALQCELDWLRELFLGQKNSNV